MADSIELAREIVKTFEGIEDGDKNKPGIQPYRDPAGYWTIGWGHWLSRDKTIPMPSITLTEEQCAGLLLTDLIHKQLEIAPLLQVELNENQMAALISFSYNVGVEALKTSTMLKKINAKDFMAVETQFLRWVYSDGAYYKGLQRRREAEMALWSRT